MIDLSLFDPIFTMMEPQLANWKLTGKLKPRTGSRSTNAVPRNAYQTQGRRLGLPLGQHPGHDGEAAAQHRPAPS